MKKPTMTQTLLFILVIGIGLFYALKYGNKAKKDIAEFESKKVVEITTQEIIELKYFGKVDLNNTEEYIDVLTNINGNEVSIDLNIIEEKITKKSILPTISFLENLPEIEKTAHKQVLSNFKNGSIVKDYIEHHIGEFNDEELKSLGIESTDSSESKKEKFLNKIHLKRIGIYPEEWDSLAIFDYTINDDLTQYLIVLKFDSDGKFVDIYTES
jgi:hypothetical protein